MAELEKRQAWIEKAVEPLGENSEWSLRARSLLDERIEWGGVRSLPELKGRPRMPWLVALLGVVLMAPLVWKTANDARMITEILRYFGMISSSGFGDQEELEAMHVEGLSKDDAEFLNGDTTKPAGVLRWEGVMKRYPDDPAMLAFFVGTWIQHENEIPDELLRKAVEIDPGNGWYDLMLAGLRADGAVDRKTKKSLYSPPDIESPTDWAIIDPAAVDETIKLLEQAAEASRIEDWIVSLNLRRIERLPEATGIAENARRQSYSAQTSAPGIMLLRHSVNVMGAAAQRFAEEADEEGLRRLIGTHERLGRLLLEKEGTLVDALVTNVFLRSPLADFREASISLGLEDELIARLDCQIEEHVERRRRMDPTPSDRDFESWMTREAAWLFGESAPMISRQAEYPPRLSESDILPGRRAEHALIGRGLSLVAGILLVGVALIWKKGSDAWSGRFAVLLGRSLGRMFGVGDRWFLALFGVGLPLLVLLLFRYLSPWGGLAWNPRLTAVRVEAPQFVLTMLLVIWCSRIAARRIIDRKLGRISGGKAGRLVPILAVLLLTIAFPLFGEWAPDENSISFYGATTLGGVGVGLLFLEFTLERRRCFIDRLLCRELTLMGIACGGAAFLFLGLGFLKEERAWIVDERMMVISSENPAFGHYETQVANQVLKELGDVLDRCE